MSISRNSKNAFKESKRIWNVLVSKSISALGGRWLREPPTAKGTTPWEFLSYSAEPELTAAELASYLQRSPTSKETPSLEQRGRGLSQCRCRSQYNTSSRVLDLVQRMLAARQQGNAVFVPQPFSDEQGLLNADGSPGELFVP